MVLTQAAILAAAAAAVRPGGVLVYSTCTISPTENEHQIAAFLATHPHFSHAESMTTLPHRDHTAGFFIAKLDRA
jgi:16S rRNA (cytosine967-C5)-methyltransferase